VLLTRSRIGRWLVQSRNVGMTRADPAWYPGKRAGKPPICPLLNRNTTFSETVPAAAAAGVAAPDVATAAPPAVAFRDEHYGGDYGGNAESECGINRGMCCDEKQSNHCDEH
jgi:hypothetical protein